MSPIRGRHPQAPGVDRAGLRGTRDRCRSGLPLARSYISDGTIRIVPPRCRALRPSSVNLQLGPSRPWEQVRNRANISNLISSNASTRARDASPSGPDRGHAGTSGSSVTTLQEVADNRPSSTAFRVSFRYEDHTWRRGRQQIIAMFPDEIRSVRQLAPDQRLPRRSGGPKRTTYENGSPHR
jgi:hypothetical protein